MAYRASAPGSLMMLGEYAVLYRRFALVGAINQRMTVTLTPRADQAIHIISALGEHRTTRHSLSPVAPFQFVLTALKPWCKRLRSGFDLVIDSEFSATMGFSSSAAVTVATLAAVYHFADHPFHLEALIREARAVIRRVQGGGSGADVAACVLGGLVAYRAAPFFVEKLPYLFPITVMYSGKKTPTPVVMAHVRDLFKDYPKIFQHYVAAIGECAYQGIQAVRDDNQARLGQIMTLQQGCMTALGVNSPSLDALINILRQATNIKGAKISGSGLGDCVIGLGQFIHEQSLSISLSSTGVICERI